MKPARIAFSATLALLVVFAFTAISTDADAGSFGKTNVRAAAQHGPHCTLPCCQPQVCYGNSPKRRYCPEDLVTAVVQVCHPCTGCVIDVPVCVPCDCVMTPPQQCDQGTLFGAGRTVFNWCCGYKVVVRYAKCGDVMVFYR